MSSHSSSSLASLRQMVSSIFQISPKIVEKRCNYPNCQQIANLSCSICDADNVHPSNFYCQDHSSHTSYECHRNLPVLTFSTDDKDNYEKFKKKPFVNFKSQKNTKFMLEITIESRTMGTFTVTNKEFGHILDSARITPKDLDVVSTAALFKREYQCFWISLGFHISCWPYILYFEALSRLYLANIALVHVPTTNLSDGRYHQTNKG